MRNVLLYLFALSIYSSTPQQEDCAEEALQLHLARKMDLHPFAEANELGFYYAQRGVSYQDLSCDMDSINNLHHSQLRTYKTHTLMRDEASNTVKDHLAVFISEQAEQALCISAIQPQRYHLKSGKTCVCTTLDSSAVLAGITSLHDIKVNVGVRTNRYKRNDFSGILEANKDKTKFAFIETAGDSLLPAGEFLFQLQQSGALHDDTEVSICIGVHATSGNYTVGNIFYGQGSQRIKDPWVNMETRLATRATQAERIASKQPCDKDFLQSSEYDERFSDWLSFVNRHVVISTVGRTYDATLFSSQTPGNIFTQNTQQDLHWQMLYKTIPYALNIDVLIGAPEKGLSSQDITRVWGAHVKVFNHLQKSGCPGRYVFAKHTNILHSPSQEIDLSDRVLICAGPQHLKGCIMSWAEEFSAGAYHQIFFTKTGPTPAGDCGYAHILSAKDSKVEDILKDNKATVYRKEGQPVRENIAEKTQA